MITNLQIKKLESIVSKSWLTCKNEDLLCYGFDATQMDSAPEVLIRPSRTEEISKILYFANQEQIPVVARGMGSGFSGGAIPIKGGILLSLERMNNILEIDVDNLLAVVEAGVITGELHRRTKEKGLYYPPDPSSSDFCTIGGNIATGASGPHSVKYGGTRDYLLGLEMVLPTGEIINVGGKTVKRSVAYDLTRLMVGAEGTLAIITKANIKLLPQPEYQQSLLAIFPSIHSAAQSISQIIRSKARPSVLEYMDEASLNIVDSEGYFGFPKEARAILMIETDGDKRVALEEAELIKVICFDNGALSFEFAKDEGEKRKIWKARKALSQSLFRLKPTKINEDIVVPRSKIAEMVQGLNDLAKKYQLTIVSFGHAGEGNLHVNIMTDKNKEEEWKRAQKAVEEVFVLTIRLGGSLSGEHGIGLSKAPYLSLELSQEEIFLMKNLKRAFDPSGILNPKKIFP